MILLERELRRAYKRTDRAHDWGIYRNLSRRSAFRIDIACFPPPHLPEPSLESDCDNLTSKEDADGL